MCEGKPVVTDKDAYIKELENTIEELKQRIENLNEIVRVLEKGKFGSSSEKKNDRMAEGQICMFNEAELEADLNDAKADGTAETDERSVEKKKGTTRKGTKHFIYNDDLPVEVVECDVPEDERICDTCGTPLKAVSKQVVREELVYRPAQLYRKQYVQTVYECPACKHSDRPVFKKGTLPVSLLNHSKASASLVAQVMTQKYDLALPLNRQERMWERSGVILSRTTMANWIIRCHDEYLRPITDRLKEALLSQDICHADETRMQVLKEPEKKPQSTSFLWAYRSGDACDKHVVIFDYQPTRAGENAKNFLGGYNGYVISDGYAGYNSLTNVIRCGCWAHLRRKFLEAVPPKKAEGRSQTAAEKGFDFCEQLFYIEKKLKDVSPQTRRSKRLELERPILEAFWSWLATVKALKGSKLEKAVTYARNQKTYLENYLLDGRIPISNNPCENAIRPFCVGRRNWLFADTQAGAKASAGIYSIVETAKANNLDVYKYLEYLLTYMPAIGLRYEIEPELLDNLMPWADKIQKTCRS